MTTVETGVAGGVSFALTAEQKELRALAREFAEKEIRPRAAEYDEHQTHATDIIAKAHEIGLMNLHLPESLGGPELPCFDGMLVGEELNWGCSGIGTSIGANGLGAGADPDRRHRGAEEAVARAARRGARSSAASGSPSRAPGSDVSGIQTTAVARGDEYVDQRVEDVHHQRRARVVDGRASPRPTAARAPRASRRSSSRWTRPASRSRSSSTRWASVRPTRRRSRSRTSSSRPRTGSASEGEGFKIAMQTLDFTRPGHGGRRGRRRPGGVRARGRYTKERVQFGMPIAMNQGVSFLVADMATEIEAARLLCWQAAWMIDEGCGPQGDEVLVVRQALRRRHGDEGDDRRGPGVRRLRLHEGVPGREADARREAVPDLRGHVADPAARDRQGDLPA